MARTGRCNGGGACEVDPVTRIATEVYGTGEAPGDTRPRPDDRARSRRIGPRRSGARPAHDRPSGERVVHNSPLLHRSRARSPGITALRHRRSMTLLAHPLRIPPRLRPPARFVSGPLRAVVALAVAAVLSGAPAWVGSERASAGSRSAGLPVRAAPGAGVGAGPAAGQAPAPGEGPGAGSGAGASRTESAPGAPAGSPPAAGRRGSPAADPAHGPSRKLPSPAPPPRPTGGTAERSGPQYPERSSPGRTTGIREPASPGGIRRRRAGSPVTRSPGPTAAERFRDPWAPGARSGPPPTPGGKGSLPTPGGKEDRGAPDPAAPRSSAVRVVPPADVPGGRAWPVGGEGPSGRPDVVRGWDPPESPYAEGHRGVDLAAAPGSAVRAAAARHASRSPGRVAGRRPVARISQARVPALADHLRAGARVRGRRGRVAGSGEGGHARRRPLPLPAAAASTGACAGATPTSTRCPCCRPACCGGPPGCCRSSGYRRRVPERVVPRSPRDRPVGGTRARRAQQGGRSRAGPGTARC